MKKRLYIVVLAMATLVAGKAMAAESGTTVTLAAVSGTRAMTVASMSGGSLTSLSMGSGREAPFLLNVTDLAYARRGYQVNAMMSNMYRYEIGEIGYTCEATSIPSSKLSLGFMSAPNAIRDVSAAVQPVLNFTGTITSGADAALLAALGLSVTENTEVAAGVTQQLADFATSTVFSGIENVLPIKLTSLATNTAFASPAPHADCDPDADPLAATAVLVQKGETNSHADLLAWLQSSADAAYDLAAGSGALTMAEAVSGGLVTQSDADAAVRGALTTLGVDPLLITDSALAAVEGLLEALPASVTDLVSQSGSYSTLPKLVVGDLTNVPTGTYRGTLTLTLVDDA